MFERKRIAIDKALWLKARQHASRSGYSSVEEFVAHALETHLARLDEAASEEEVRARLKGLGYLA